MQQRRPIAGPRATEVRREPPRPTSGPEPRPTPPILRRPCDLVEGVPDPRRASSAGRRRQVQRRRRTSTSTSRGARRSGSWGSRAAASRPPAACCSTSSRPPSGTCCFDGRDTADARREDMRKMRRRIQIVFQDPYASLNPRMTVGAHPRRAAAGPPRAGPRPRRGPRRRAARQVGLSPEHASRYPHEFSGGQRQRVGIARALGARPRADRARRAGVRARRVDPGRRGQPAGAPAGRARPGLRVHRPRPVGRAPHLRPGGGDVPGQDRRDRHPRRHLRRAGPPLHPGAAVGGAAARSPPGAHPRADRARGRRAQPRRPAVGLPVPHPLLEAPELEEAAPTCRCAPTRSPCSRSARASATPSPATSHRPTRSSDGRTYDSKQKGTT